MATRNDDLKDSFYLHIMRSSIGVGLRHKYAPHGNMPERLSALLHQLDHSADEPSASEPGADAGDSNDLLTPSRPAPGSRGKHR
jgi:hypothetical protein